MKTASDRHKTNSGRMQEASQAEVSGPGCLSLKLCKNCHFNMKLNSVHHYWLNLWGFGVFFFP